jgi:hydrogenase-4 component F
VGRAGQLKGSQQFADIAGLARNQAALGLTLGAGIVAVAGLPPFGLFTSEFLIVSQTVRTLPWLAIPLGLGLVVGGWALATRLLALLGGPPTPDRGPAPSLLALAPAWLHLAVVVVLGLAMPGAVVAWLTTIAASAS